MFGKKRFKELIVSMREQTLFEQKFQILQALDQYQGDEDRRDDVSVIGLKV